MNKSNTDNTSQNKSFGKGQEELKAEISNAMANLTCHSVFFEEFEQEIKSLNKKSTSIERLTTISTIDSALQLINKVLSCLPLLSTRNNSKNIEDVKNEINELLIFLVSKKKRALLNCLVDHKEVTQ